MNFWEPERRQDLAIKITLFFISPFFAFIYALRRINTKSSYLVFFLVAIFFGMAFTVDSGKSDEVKYDGAAYRYKFDLYQNIESYEFFEGFRGFLTFDDGKKDYYFDTVAFYVSRFTENYHVLFMVFAIIFAYFSLKSFRFLTAEEKFDASIGSLILAYFFLSNQIFNINGMRFWTAAWIAVYCIFQIYRNGNRRYFLLAFLTPFFHGSYWVFIGVLLIATYLRRFEKQWFIAFIASFFISSFSVELIRGIQPYLPAFLSAMVNSYADADYIELRQSWSGFGFIPLIFSKVKLFYLALMVFLFYRHSKEIKSNPKTKDLYLFLLVWISIFNFLMFAPSLGGRFITLSFPIMAYIWLVSFKGKRYSWFLMLFPIVSAWGIMEQLRHYLQVTEFDFWVSSPFYLTYKYLLTL